MFHPMSEKNFVNKNVDLFEDHTIMTSTVYVAAGVWLCANRRPQRAAWRRLWVP